MKETDPEGVAPRRWGATPSGSVRFVILFRGLRSDARASSLTPAITFIPFGDFQSFFRTASCVLQDIFQIQLQARGSGRSEEHTSELQSRQYLVCRLLLEKKKKTLEQSIHLYC